MARCPACHRRLPPAGRCPQDSGTAPDAAAAPARPAPPVAPHFSVSALLGIGGFGAVWDAIDDKGARVAIKVGHTADANARLRLEREGRAMARLGPSHAPRFHGSGVLADGRPYLAMEHLHGATLAEEMERWPAAPSVFTVGALGEALLASASALHARGVAHLDLKPENVFLVRSGEKALEAKLMDFGLSQDPQDPAPGGDGGAGAGTPEYMAPEQITRGKVDLPADVYALGVMLFEIATLRLPFTGEKRELEYAHFSSRPPRPSRFAAVPETLEEIILRCLAKDPALRFADACVLQGEFARALTGLAASPAVSPADQPRPSSAPSRPSVLRGSERQKAVLIFAQGAHLAAVEMQAALESFGGQVAHTQPGLAACAFTHHAGENVGQRALAAAEALVAKSLCDRVILDIGTVMVRPRPSGAPRVMSPLFTDTAHYPSASDPAGILLTGAAYALFPAMSCEPAPGKPSLFILERASAETTQSRTVVQEATVPLVGRGDILELLMAEAGTALGEWRPRVAGVIADAGLGKSRLAFELARRLRERMPLAEVIELRAREPLGSHTDDTFAELLRRALKLPPERPPDAGRAILTDRLGDVARETFAGAALLLGWIAADDPAIAALRAAPGVLRANMARAGLEALRNLATRRPVLVLLDDVHWADDALLDALEQASVSELPLWICAFGRPSFAESRPTWGHRAAHVQSLRLGPLDLDSAAQLTRLLLIPAIDVPEPVIRRLVDRAQAVPLLLVDLVGGLRREGLIRTQAGGVAYVATEVIDSLPDSPLVEWIAGRELDQLPADLAAHARLVSLLAAEITAGEVQGVVAALTTVDRDLADAFPMDALVGLERLKQMRLLVQHRNGRYGFRNAILREAVAGTVAAGLATRVHGSALQYYRTSDLPQVNRLPRVAWHAAKAGDRLLASTTYLGMAESARERHNYLEADLLYTNAMAQLDQPDESRRLIALKGRGMMRYRLGRYQGALDDLAQAEELACRVGDAATQADVMLDESTALDWLFEWHRSSDLASLAMELLRGLDLPALQARALLAMGRSMHRFNRDAAAADLLRKAAQQAETVGDEAYEVQVDAGLLLGFLLPFMGAMDEAEQRLQDVGRLCEAKGDEFHLGALWGNRACLWLVRNDRPRFMEDTQRVLAYCRRMGAASLERNATLNSAYFLYWRAEFAAAEPYARRLIEIDTRYFRQGGFRPDGAVLLARILWHQGDKVEASRLVELVRSQQAAVRAEAKTELLLQPNDAMLFDMIDLVVAGAAGSAWEPLVARARSVAQGQELIEVLEMAGLAAQQRRDQASAANWWREALVAGERIPNIMGDRIRERLDALAGG